MFKLKPMLLFGIVAAFVSTCPTTLFAGDHKPNVGKEFEE